MKKCSILAEGFLMIFILAWIHATEGFVNLTVDGGGSLSGAYCPGTVKLFCEGTDLTSVRWSFNGGTVIESFLPIDAETTTFPSAQYPAFVSVELTHVVQNTNPVFGNFSSILTVDLSQLEEQSVSSISCGDPGTSKTVPVNVVIIRQSVPDRPNITGVNATYNSTGLKSVTVSWNKVPTDCPEYGLSLMYIADLTGSDPVKVNETSCGVSFCLATFEGLFSDNVEYELTLSVMNDVGSSGLVQYPTVIGSQSGQYITPVLNSSNCITSGQCISSGTLPNGTMCSVQYTTDDMYNRGLSTVMMVPLHTTFHFPRLSLDGTLYFVFTVPVESSFLVGVQVEFTTGANPQLTTVGIIVISFTGLLVVLSLLLMIVVLVVLCMDWKTFFSRRWTKFTAPILLALHMLLLVASVVLLISGIIVGIQQDTCDAKWQQTRDGLLISSLIVSFLGVVTMSILMVFVVVVTNQNRKKSGEESIELQPPVGNEERRDDNQSPWYVLNCWSTGQSPPSPIEEHNHVPQAGSNVISSATAQQPQDRSRVPIASRKTFSFDLKKFGLRIAGSQGDDPAYEDMDDQGIFIVKVLPGGLAEKDGRLQEGDKLVEINNVNVTNATRKKAVDALKSASGSCSLVVSRKVPIVLPVPSRKTFSFDSKNFGFEIAGGQGKDPAYKDVDDQGIFIVNILPRGLAEKDGKLQEGDKLVEIDNVNVMNAARSKAIDALKSASGSCSLVVLRKVLATITDVDEKTMGAQRNKETSLDDTCNLSIEPNGGAKPKKMKIIQTRQNTKTEDGDPHRDIPRLT